MTTDDWTRNLTRQLFGRTAENQPPTDPPPPAPITGPVIPGQEAEPSPVLCRSYAGASTGCV
ncbi:MAG: hypothetical protein QJR09_13565, partial [Micrococcus sp.]|nr:hypothetical protein [Micrococcus sp.]